MKSNTLYQMFLFALAGAVATVVDWVFYYIFLHIFTFKYGYMPASCIGFIFGVLVSYYISIKWIFTARNIKNRKLELFIFFIIGIIGLALTQLFMYLFNEINPFKEITQMLSNLLSPLFVLAHEWSSRIIVTVIVFFWNFFARKVIIFNDKKI